MATSSLAALPFQAELNMARQALYRFTSVALLDPRAGSWRELERLRGSSLPEASAALVRGQTTAQADPLGPGERPLATLTPAAVMDRLPGSAALLNAEYERTFGLVVANACPPYETEYIGSKFAFQRSNAMADVSGYYRAFGLAGSRAHRERPDHIVIELEFMAVLLGLERQAAETGDAAGGERGHICRGAQRRFLEEHLAWWTPAFARLVERENGTGFYAAVASFLAALIPAERALLDVEVAAHDVAPTRLERSEECEGCQLGS
ncbi:MAG: hypothetical protein BMS9Abin04_148 [Planctomycetia bacterium]|nr:MAG: hypothetical protein BMS9Abin04_148 [Planctomycetia bacterium]